MTQDEIIAMAEKVDIYVMRPDEFQSVCIKDLEAFAKLIAAHVSRELAKECAGSGEWTAVHIIERVEW